MSTLYSDDKIRQRAERIVEHEVRLLLSSLVSDVVAAACPAALGLDEDELTSLCVQSRTVYRCDVCDAEHETEDDAREHWVSEHPRDWIAGHRAEIDEVINASAANVDVDDDEREMWLLNDEGLYSWACSDAAVTEDEDVREAYEHWAVSPWLAGQLEARGEIVADTNVGHVWGRCTTGQAISLDDVILVIAADLERDA